MNFFFSAWNENSTIIKEIDLHNKNMEIMFPEKTNNKAIGTLKQVYIRVHTTMFIWNKHG